jgi:uncharacterized protein YciI
MLTRTLYAMMFCAAAFAAEAEYIFGFVRTAPSAKPMPAEERKRLQAGHMAHIGAMAESGGLVGAGPIAGGRERDLRGIFIFKGGAKAKELTDADPYVKAGEMIIELHAWRAAAGIGDRYAAEHKANPSAPVKMMRVQLLVLAPGAEAAMARVRTSGKVLAGGPLGNGKAVYAIQAGGVEAAKALAGEGAEVHEWLVAEGVLPDPH